MDDLLGHFFYGYIEIKTGTDNSCGGNQAFSIVCSAFLEIELPLDIGHRNAARWRLDVEFWSGRLVVMCLNNSGRNKWFHQKCVCIARPICVGGRRNERMQTLPDLQGRFGEETGEE